MTVKITDRMLVIVGGGAFNTIENVGKVRRILAEAGVTDVELHPLEIRAAVAYADSARLQTEAVRTLLASGPAPAEHTCELREDGDVSNVFRHGDCPFGCAPGKPRVELPEVADHA